MPTGHYSAEPSGPRAGFWLRFAAVFVDGLVFGAFTSLLFAATGTPTTYWFAVLLALAYYTCFEGSRRGQTLGKRLLGIRVIDLNTGESIGYNRAALRYLGSIVSAIALYIGYLWMLWDGEKQCWHDKFASAVVVPESVYPVR